MSGWTSEREETLIKLWNDGKSASHIAKELSGVTRNAVIGKVHRLGLTRSDKPKVAVPKSDPNQTVKSADRKETWSAGMDSSLRKLVLDEKVDFSLFVTRLNQQFPNRKTSFTEESVQVRMEHLKLTLSSSTPARDPASGIGVKSSRHNLDVTAEDELDNYLTPKDKVNTALKNELDAEALGRKGKRLGVLGLTEKVCKWPIGDPATDDLFFCGLPSADGKPYCKKHCKVAFVPIVPHYLGKKRGKKPSMLNI